MEKLFSVPLKLNSMYLRGDGKRNVSGVAGSRISTDTYFGCFPCEAYSKNTVLKSIRACIRVTGTGIVELHHLNGSGDRTIASKDFSLAAPETIGITVPLSRYASGCLFLRAAGGLDIEGIWYEGEGEAKEARIAVIICTYRREEYILKNLGRLSRTLEEAPELRENVQVICVDNGGTLDLTGKAGITGTRDKNGSKDTGRICLVRNRNYGGSGGYARGMLEAKRMGCTHFWLMDDDIRFDPAIIRRAFTFLKYRKTDDIALAAGMFSFEQPTVQYEATAVFNGYTFVSNAAGLDFRDRDALLKNRVQSSGNTYGGWWSLVMPAADELPMPFFIKLDDVEYGLRLKPAYVIMNGFGVWHEAFGKKGNAWAEYYTARNTLILQDLHPELPRCAVKMMGIRLLKALAYGEPKCMEAALKGAEDYASGPGRFAAMDPEARHKEVLSVYRASLAQDMNRKKMLGAAAINLVKPRNLKSVAAFFAALKVIAEARRGKKNNAGPRSAGGWERLQTERFWRQYLGPGPDRKEGKQESNEEPLVSIIIPVYNVSEYLPECLESVCGQTYRNIEIILVDDGSTDGSGEICDAWKEKDARIKVIHKENGGVSSARNEGFKHVTGDLIGFVDGDDWLEPEMYEKLVKAIRGADAAACGFVDYPYGKTVPIPKGTRPVESCGFEDAVVALFERNGYFSSLWNKLFRREAVFKEGGPVLFDLSLAFGEDELWLITVLRGCTKVAFVPEALYHWRPRDGSITRITGVSEKRLSLLKAKSKVMKLLPERADVRKLAEGRFFNDCYFLKVDAYCAGERDKYRKVDTVLRPMRRSWLGSRNVQKLRKIKVFLMDMEMMLRMPAKIIRFTDRLKRMPMS